MNLDEDKEISAVEALEKRVKALETSSADHASCICELTELSINQTAVIASVLVVCSALGLANPVKFVPTSEMPFSDLPSPFDKLMPKVWEAHRQLHWEKATEAAAAKTEP